MSEEKKHNGWLTFWEHGFMGVKDYDGHVVISPSLGFTEVSELRGETCIVKKNGKCWLADAEGNLLTATGYDRIIHMGEEYYKAGMYKAGVLARPSGKIVVEYADVSHVYELLDGKGNILIGREKGFNYMSEVFDGELTAARNGRCGVIDLQGNVLMDFRYKYIQPMGEGMYLPSMDGEDNYWSVIIDKDGNVMIPASKQYRSIYQFHNGVARAYQDGKWGIIDHRGNHVVEFNYSYVEEWGEGYFKVEQGAKKNIMRSDGSIVLKDWYSDVFMVSNGFFIFGNTLRKSKTNPKTRYIQGVAHVNGDIIFPMIFERARWFEDKSAIYAELGTTPYILTLDGGIYDPARSHLSNMIHKLSEDADLDGFIREEDNFPYHGVKDSVCEGCIYANGIQGHGEGCGRLFIKSFRERYLKGRCEYRKTDLAQPSEFERRDLREKKLAKETVEKQCDKYAVDLLRKFVSQRLDGDIKKLKDFDFDSLKDDREFGDERDITVWGLESMLIKAVVTLAFAGTWPGFTYESMDKHKYKAAPIHITNTIFGIHFADYYKALETYDVPSALRERVIRFGKRVHTIGNIMVLPCGLSQMRDTKPMGRGYMDVFLREFHKMMAGEGKCNMKILDAIDIKKKEIVGFRTEQNFKNIAYGLMLDDFLDNAGRPKPVFQGLFCWEPSITREAYLKAATEFLDFCEPFIDKRADRIIEQLSYILKNNQ